LDPVLKLVNLVLSFQAQEKTQDLDVDNSIDGYNNLHEASVSDREDKYAKLVDAYYDLATIFYEFGWGDQFHFALRKKDDTFYRSLDRHEEFLSDKLGLKKGDKVLDCGCGIGGPYRNIAKYSGADITGITINHYQVKRANFMNKRKGLDKQVRSQQGDFMKLPFPDNSFDHVYAIEATCHAPNRVGVYSEICRVLKPGGKFACYEWCLVDNKYDPKNEDHHRIKKWIEEGDGLPDMAYTKDVDKCITESGLKLLETEDRALMKNPGGSSWYEPLVPGFRYFTQLQFTSAGKKLMPMVLSVLETFKLAPPGTSKVQEMLARGGVGCADGGITGTFTPMWFMLSQKPKK